MDCHFIRNIVCAALPLVMLTASAASQTHPAMPRGEYIDRHFDSSERGHDATTDTDIVFSEVIATEGALWTRLYFAQVTLDGQSAIRMTSLRDGETQTLDAESIIEWNHSSAYFNGNAVLVELIADEGSQGNRVVLDQIAVDFGDGGSPIGTCGLCNGDSRVPSDALWTGRVMPVGCSASIYNEQSCAVSAGHCMSSANVLQFNVPDSLGNCDTQNPPINDQFPVTGQISQNSGVGGDWAAMTIGTNGLGQTPYDRYGEFRPIATSVASVGNPVQVFGYGVSSNCPLSQTQQLSEGTINAVQSNTYRALIDVTFGNSGSALLWNDQIIGIVTHCDTCGTGNIMNRIDAPAFVDARSQICPAPPLNNDCQDSIQIFDGLSPFTNIGATTTGPAEPDTCTFEGDGNVHADVWFRYTATCTGTATFSLCDGEQPEPGSDCAGFCGGQSSAGCWCDTSCAELGDCCDDICEDCPTLTNCQSGSCAGHCGGVSPDGCWCDNACDSFGDCCPGVCNDCPNLTHCLSGGTTTANTSMSAFNTKLAVYGADCPTTSDQVLACNTNTCGVLSEVELSVQQGQTYRIRVGGHFGAQGEGILTISCEDEPIKDCHADITGDGIVNVDDLLQVLNSWGTCAEADNCPADVDDNGNVDVDDLLSILNNWGPCDG